MMNEAEKSAARERVLDAAEELFSEHGYVSVTLRDIADRLKIKVSSLYYHAPGGKEELFVMVTERTMQRHRQELLRVIEAKADDWQGQLYDIANWLLSRPPLDVTRVINSDAHRLSLKHQQQVMNSMWLVMEPVQGVFLTAKARETNPMPDAGLLAGVFLTIVNGLNMAPFPHDPNHTKKRAVDEILAVFIKGLLAP